MKLKAKRPVNHGGKSHQPGDVFEVPDNEAKHLISAGHAEQVIGEEHDPAGKKTPPFSTGGQPSTSGGKS